MKVSSIILALTTVVSAVLAEAPLDYSTTQQDSFAPPSPNAPSSSYGVPSSSYGPPSSSYGPPSGRRQTAAVLRPSANYGAPPPSSSYGAPGVGGGRRGGGTFSGNFGGHQNNFGGGSGFKSRGSFRPSASYGAPSTGYGAPSRGGYDDGSSEPASYQFSYHVQDAPSGNDFGHQESREGHKATGMYMVLLPDGRRQIVEYTADETGYHPIVRYEGTATGGAGGGYPSGPSGSGGYRY